jgi:hypothetical protein
MANDTYKIQVGPDEEVTVPAWATESTLSRLKDVMISSKVAAELMASWAKKDIKTKEEMAAAMEGMAAHAAKSEAATAKANKQKKNALDKQILGVTKASKDAIDKFSNTDAPLSSMVDMAGDFGESILGAGKGMAANANSNSALAKTANVAIPLVGALGTAAMAVAGFQAAQIEQFAKAQESMIDSGAIMFGGVEPYENLKHQAIQSGLTYTELSKLVSKSGVGFQSLGNGVSTGTSAFLSMFKSVNKTGDQFGDYGLRSADMAEVLSDYINIQRMTLSKDMALVSTQNSVEAGFHELMIETTALASLTGENRSELLQKRMAALATPQVAAALKVMDENGGGHAEVARSFIGQFALLESSMGPIGKDISDKFNSYIFKIADQPENFDFSQAVGSDLAIALDKANNGVVGRINEAFRSGDVDNAQNMLVEAMAEMRHAEVGSSNVVAGSVQDIIHQLAVAGNMVHVQMQEMLGMSKSEQAAYFKEIEEKSNVSGALTKSMNDMKVSFMEVQNAFTLSIENGTEMANYLSSALLSGAKTIQKLVGKVSTVGGDIYDLTADMWNDPSWKTIKAFATYKVWEAPPRVNLLPEGNSRSDLSGAATDPDRFVTKTDISNIKDDHEKVVKAVVSKAARNLLNDVWKAAVPTSEKNQVLVNTNAQKQLEPADRVLSEIEEKLHAWDAKSDKHIEANGILMLEKFRVADLEQNKHTMQEVELLAFEARKTAWVIANSQHKQAEELLMTEKRFLKRLRRVQTYSNIINDNNSKEIRDIKERNMVWFKEDSNYSSRAIDDERAEREHIRVTWEKEDVYTRAYRRKYDKELRERREEEWIEQNNKDVQARNLLAIKERDDNEEFDIASFTTAQKERERADRLVIKERDRVWALDDEATKKARSIFDREHYTQRKLDWEWTEETNATIIEEAFMNERKARELEWNNFGSINKIEDPIEIAKEVMKITTIAWLQKVWKDIIPDHTGRPDVFQNQPNDNRPDVFQDQQSDVEDTDTPVVDNRSRAERLRGKKLKKVKAGMLKEGNKLETLKAANAEAIADGLSAPYPPNLDGSINTGSYNIGTTDDPSSPYYRSTAGFVRSSGGGIDDSSFDASVDGRKFGGPVIKDKSYIVGEEGQELFTPASSGTITNANKTSLMLDSVNNNNDDMSKHLEEMVAMKTQTVAVLKQMKAAMKSINRSKDYKRAVDNLA